MSKNYFLDDCIVKNEIYNSLKNFIICPKCKNIFKNPLICSKCSTSFCEKCINDKSRCENCFQENIEFKESKSKNELLSSLKYKCKNCLEEVNKSDIITHLQSNCQNKKEERTLHEIYTTKKELKRLSQKEMNKKLDNNEKIYVLKSKIKKYNFGFSNNIR